MVIREPSPDDKPRPRPVGRAERARRAGLPKRPGSRDLPARQLLRWPEKVVGGKYVHQLERLIAQLRPDDAHGNCRLFLDDVFIAYLLAFFNPALRSLRTLEDFSEVESKTAYFDGDPVIGLQKGARRFTREEVAAMAAFQNMIALPPAPKLDVFGLLVQKAATPSEQRGEVLFNGKARCSTCHPTPYYTDNLAHDLKVERFYPGRAEGIIKTFTLRGLKDSPPYLHDGRLPTIEDTVQFFDLVLETKLTREEKDDLAAFLKTL